jgi:glycerol-1-phosphate dehydrogenase [NAD(P)+]
MQAPRLLCLSGIGDLASKFTAIHDWKLAFHHHGEPVNDFAALLSDGSVHAFMARPNLDVFGLRLLATSLMLNGIAMEVCGSSRPASGSEHLISHALDEITTAPRLHGVQVGVASYLVSLLQGLDITAVDQLFETTGFWQAVYDDPFSIHDWLNAIQLAPTIKPDFFTVLDTRDVMPEVKALVKTDTRLSRCFVG